MYCTKLKWSFSFPCLWQQITFGLVFKKNNITLTWGHKTLPFSLWQRKTINDAIWSFHKTTKRPLQKMHFSSYTMTNKWVCSMLLQDNINCNVCLLPKICQKISNCKEPAKLTRVYITRVVFIVSSNSNFLLCCSGSNYSLHNWIYIHSSNALYDLRC